MTASIQVLDPTAFRIGGFAVQWYAVFIALGAFIGYSLFKRETDRMGYSEDIILDLVFWAVMLGFLGARLYYVVFKLDYYLANPSQILNIRGGGMAIYGGVIAGSLTIFYLAKKYKLKLLSLLDAVSPSMLIAQSIGRWGNFMNQEAHGGPVTKAYLQGLYLPDWLIEQMKIKGVYYHPTFLYESVWNLFGFIIIFSLRHRHKFLLSGEVAAFYLIWYGLGRFFIEGMRTDSLYWGPVRVSQALSLVLVLLGIGFLIYQRRFSLNHQYYSDQLLDLKSKESI